MPGDGGDLLERAAKLRQVARRRVAQAVEGVPVGVSMETHVPGGYFCPVVRGCLPLNVPTLHMGARPFFGRALRAPRPGT